MMNFPTPAPRYHDPDNDLCLLVTGTGPCICDVLQQQDNRGYAHGRISAAADILADLSLYGRENENTPINTEDEKKAALTRLTWMEALTVAADIALGDNAGDVQRMLDEMEQDCPHNDAWFDRVICPEPCGMMHTYCADCGANLDTCTFDSNPPDGIPL